MAGLSRSSSESQKGRAKWVVEISPTGSYEARLYFESTRSFYWRVAKDNKRDIITNRTVRSYIDIWFKIKLLSLRAIDLLWLKFFAFQYYDSLWLKMMFETSKHVPQTLKYCCVFLKVIMTFVLPRSFRIANKLTSPPYSANEYLVNKVSMKNKIIFNFKYNFLTIV